MICKIEKPWGREEILEHNDNYVVKKLIMKKGHCCSLQYHKKKHETVYVLYGSLSVSYGDSAHKLSVIVVKDGEYIVIPPTKIHRMEALEYAVYLECSTPELDDVIRIEDNYGRAK